MFFFFFRITHALKYKYDENERCNQTIQFIYRFLVCLLLPYQSNDNWVFSEKRFFLYNFEAEPLKNREGF